MHTLKSGTTQEKYVFLRRRLINGLFVNARCWSLISLKLQLYFGVFFQILERLSTLAKAKAVHPWIRRFLFLKILLNSQAV